jgi:hypothetical protein
LRDAAWLRAIYTRTCARVAAQAVSAVDPAEAAVRRRMASDLRMAHPSDTAPSRKLNLSLRELQRRKVRATAVRRSTAPPRGLRHACVETRVYAHVRVSRVVVQVHPERKVVRLEAYAAPDGRQLGMDSATGTTDTRAHAHVPYTRSC